ncbi:hypothetical protein [Anaerobacillus sp. 1_MG-2023]|uniref:hypothetical protein n=1 Tax=Anaerobacillus sp. 1_MG-2023 TaxID=3062655 RepID=UPI0026E15FE2|nr:hypothetical protein [Anaerobacillus sp. 1_MG-2023]MDO6657188.1 hypothetical protein [Anaerobacillus sp. 1_MG-2023]
MLSVNSVYLDKTLNIKFRILHLLDGVDEAYVYEYSQNPSMPVCVSKTKLYQMVIKNEVVKISDEFTFISDINNLSDKLKSESERIWKIMKPLVYSEPDIYIKSKRAKLIKDLQQKEQLSQVTIYGYLKRYWHGGMNRNSLIDRRYFSGGKGGSKNLEDRKIGRPSEYRPGMNATKDVKNNIKWSLDKYYFPKLSSTYKFAYQMMLKEFYTEMVRGENGFKELNVNPQAPTYRQYMYWAHKIYNFEELKSKKVGLKKYQRDHRSVLGSSVYETEGPGFRFEMDATPADIYLVSTFDRNHSIGKPVLYIVVDVFSKLITGFYIGVGNASWNSAIHALVNTAKDKVKLCAEYGIDIEAHEWPAAHFPKYLLTDKGEGIGLNSDALIDNFGITLENTSSYRADMKGTVERLLGLIPKMIQPFAPGYIEKDFRERGGKDYRLDALFTIKEFSSLIIRCILHYNNKYAQKYPLTKEMLLDKVKPIPNSIWDWGLKNRSGALKSYEPYYVYLYLLPRSTAVISKEGIVFRTIKYTCETAESEHWFSKARDSGRWKVNVCFDYRTPEVIYLIKHNDLEPCYLLPHQEMYLGTTIEEIDDLLSTMKKSNYKEKQIQLNKDINFIDMLEQNTKSMIKDAKKEKADGEVITQKANVENMKMNRAKQLEVDVRLEINKLNPEKSKEDNNSEKKDTSIPQYKLSIKDLGLYNEEE